MQAKEAALWGGFLRSISNHTYKGSFILCNNHALLSARKEQLPDMSMYMNMRNGASRPMGKGAQGRPSQAPCTGEPIMAGGAAEAMGNSGENREDADFLQGRPCGRPCPPSVPFCETLTLHESFDASCITEEGAHIAYDTRFLGYTVEETTMKAALSCGGYCMVPVQRIMLTGAIPYLISIGPVRASCGDPVNLCIQGSTLVDEVVGYICAGEDDPELDALDCNNVVPCLCVSTEPCGCSDKTNVTVCGRFVLHNLPVL